jgi:HlyD family secretion protein
MNVISAEFAPPRVDSPRLLSNALGVQPFASVPPIPRLFARVVYLLVALVGATCLWATFAKVDIIVAGQGRLIAPRQQLSMQVYETSVVKSIDVRVGQIVKKGQPLALLDPTFTNADRADYENQVASLKAALDRCEAELAGRPYNPNPIGTTERAQLRIYNERQTEREAHIQSLVKKIEELKVQYGFAQANEPLLANQVEFAHDTVGMYQKLVDKQLGAKDRLLSAKIKESEVTSKLIENRQDQQKLQEQIAGAIADRDSYTSEWTRELAEEYEKGRTDLETAVAKLAKAQRRDDLISMVAPMDASVLDIPKRNVGSVLREGETLMTLVPADVGLPLDVAIETKDVAYLREGQQVRIKFEALPYQRYGTADGTLRLLTFDTTTDTPASEDDGSTSSGTSEKNKKRYYRAEISIDRQNFRNLPPDFEFRPGMKGSAEVKVGLRTVAEYVLHPVMRVFDEGLREK